MRLKTAVADQRELDPKTTTDLTSDKIVVYLVDP